MTSGAILTGGHARRFGGQDKSRVLVDGRTILARQIDVLRPCVGRLLLVGRQRPAESGLEMVTDRLPDLGPLGGLEAALAAVWPNAVLLVACDLPYLTTPFLAHLVSLLDGVDAVVPHTERGYHPLCAVYAQSCGATVRRRLETRSLRMRDLVADLRVRTVDTGELSRFGNPRDLLTNINSRADLDALGSLSH
jgi:molybdopterin-guanine dinucleotide biosynthesis protein A